MAFLGLAADATLVALSRCRGSVEFERTLLAVFRWAPGLLWKHYWQAHQVVGFGDVDFRQRRERLVEAVRGIRGRVG